MSKSPKDTPDLDEARLRQQAIGARLRQLFEDVVSEPVPEDFLEILRRAESRDSPTGEGDGADHEPDSKA